MPKSRHSSFVKPFEPSSCAAALRRPERLDPRRRQIIDEARDQRRLRADDDEADVFRPAKAT